MPLEMLSILSFCSKRQICSTYKEFLIVLKWSAALPSPKSNPKTMWLHCPKHFFFFFSVLICNVHEGCLKETGAEPNPAHQGAIKESKSGMTQVQRRCSNKKKKMHKKCNEEDTNQQANDKKPPQQKTVGKRPGSCISTKFMMQD